MRAPGDAAAFRRIKEVTKTNEHDTMSISEESMLACSMNDDHESLIHDILYKEEKSIEVHTIGRIDKNIYKCVTEEIVTDEVIITDERIAHIYFTVVNKIDRIIIEINRETLR